MLQIRRIVCPIDFSETSDHALRYALELAERFDATLLVVHAYQLTTFGLVEAPILPAEEYVSRLRTDLMRALDDVARRYSGRRTTIDRTLVEGVPWAEIVRIAEEHHADMIVMGTHGRSGLRHVVLGSVAERVVRMAHCPVVTVRGSKES